MFHKKTVRDIDVQDKTVLVRIDWDVPADDEGNVQDDFRIRSSIETLNYLIDHNCKIIVMSKRGRPKENEERLSLRRVAACAEELLGKPVGFVPHTTGPEVVRAVSELGHGEILCLENLRFDPREKAKDIKLAEELAALADVFVMDAFAMAHRTEPSVIGVPQFIPGVSGLLVEREVSQINEAIKNPKKPLLAITGGSKLETKLPLLDTFLGIADKIVVAGVMANTLLVAKGYSVGASLYEAEMIDQAKAILERAESSSVEIFLPTLDVAVGQNLEDSERVEKRTGDVAGSDLILDFGKESMAQVRKFIAGSSTILWNGPLGYYENSLFAHGSEETAKAIAQQTTRGAMSVVGGGDTADVVNNLNLSDRFSHVSTGGGASLELMAGNMLPGVEALLDKD